LIIIQPTGNRCPKNMKRHYNSGGGSRPDILLWQKENGLRNSGGVSRTAKLKPNSIHNCGYRSAFWAGINGFDHRQGLEETSWYLQIGFFCLTMDDYST
jgi:hypothetical protein